MVTFNARGPRHHRHPLEFGGAVRRDAVCVHPVRGGTGEAPVSSAAHGGAVFFDTDRPQLLPRFVGSRCSAGRLVVDELAPLPDRGLAPSILLRVMGGENYHPIEYQLFYVDLRHDALARVHKQLSQRPGARSAREAVLHALHCSAARHAQGPGGEIP